MPIVYLCPTGTHASLVAANLHLGKLSITSTTKEIIDLPYFGKHLGLPGMFLYIGRDFNDNKIYTLATSNEAKLIKKSAKDLLNILGVNPDNIQLRDVSTFLPYYVTWYQKINYQISKRIIAGIIHRKLIVINNEIEFLKRQAH